jgi:hypothetical protein
MSRISPIGKQFILTEGEESVSVRPILGNQMLLPNGERVQVKRYWSDSAIATGASDSTLIAAPATSEFYLVVIGYAVMCDADTLVTFRSNSTTIGMPLPIGSKGGIVREISGQAYLVGVPGQALAITTSGGNTYLDLHFIEVPINVDIL